MLTPTHAGLLLIQRNVVCWEQSNLSVVLTLPPVLVGEFLCTVSTRSSHCRGNGTYHIDDFGTVREAQLILFGSFIIVFGRRSW